MTPTSPPPIEYPQQAYERKEGGTVQVELTFIAPDKPPRTKVLNRPDVFQDLMHAVGRHVAQFRLPCMAGDAAPVVMRQDYVFTPNDGRKVMSTAPRDGDEDRRAKLAACLKRGPNPEYPRHAQVRHEYGPVLVRLTFAAADQPPRAEVLVAGVPALREAVLEHLRDARLPCFDGGTPVSLSLQFNFQLEGVERIVLRDTTLVKLLAAGDRLKTPVYFDLNSMGCPFDLRIRYFQPYRANEVRELETQNPARMPFIDWLSGLKLKTLGKEQDLAVLGQEMTVTVPCGKIDL